MMKVFTIAVLGTSLTAGSAGWTSRTYLNDVVPLLEAGKQSSVRALNFGIPGGNTRDGFAPMVIAARMRPDVIVMEYSMNDCIRPMETARTDEIAMIKYLQTNTPGSQLFLMTMNPAVGNSAGAIYRKNVGEYYDLYREVAAATGVGLIDTHPNWAGVTEGEVPDGIHPTADANLTYLVPTLVAALAPLVV